MITPQRWFERCFAFDLPAERFPLIVERLRGTPLRVRERVAGVEEHVLTRRVDEQWSMQENVGHLLDLEPLWSGRIEDILAGHAIMREADLSNTKTDEAHHNDVPLDPLLGAFENARLALVAQFDALDVAAVEATALHPRLKQPMRIIDLAFFVAEHDDHHLARITALRGAR